MRKGSGAGRRRAAAAAPARRARPACGVPARAASASAARPRAVGGERARRARPTTRAPRAGRGASVELAQHRPEAAGVGVVEPARRSRGAPGSRAETMRPGPGATSAGAHGTPAQAPQGRGLAGEGGGVAALLDAGRGRPGGRATRSDGSRREGRRGAARAGTVSRRGDPPHQDPRHPRAVDRRPGPRWTSSSRPAWTAGASTAPTRAPTRGGGGRPSCAPPPERAGRPLALLFDLAGPEDAPRLRRAPPPGHAGRASSSSRCGDDRAERRRPGGLARVRRGRHRGPLGDRDRRRHAAARGARGAPATRASSWPRCERPGTIGPRKGIYVTYVRTPGLDASSEKDLADLAVAVELEADIIALSFVRSGQDVRRLRGALDVARQPRPGDRQDREGRGRTRRSTRSSTSPTA